MDRRKFVCKSLITIAGKTLSRGLKKKQMKKVFSVVFLILTSLITGFSQKEDLTQVWPAKWIISADGPAKEFSVHHFRKSFNLEKIPEKLVVHSSGDNRYQLFVNGEMVTQGPLRGDLRHWFYESTNISPYLSEGKNVIAALVLNYGSHPPDAQLSVQTGFLLAADDRQFRFLNTGNGWKSAYNKAYSPYRVTKDMVNGYYGGGSREIVDGREYIRGWEKPDFNDENWKTAEIIENAYAKSCKWASRWKITPRILKHERVEPIRFESVRMVENLKIPADFPRQVRSFTISENTVARFVLDQAYLTTAYPLLRISGGKDAEITFTYVEAPYIGDPRYKQKGNRNEVDNKNFVGYRDKYISNGKAEQEYKPLWWRTYRYIEVSIETRDEALEILDISGLHSSYPFEQKAVFIIESKNVDIHLISKIIETGHRTMLANAHEHFTDCPYYEESQFEGDTRVECLVSYLNYGDPALAKNAIEQFSWSVNDEGFLSARYPTNSLYYIPNFSIYWIAMLYDYMMYVDNLEFVKSKLPVMRHVLNYFESKEREDGRMKKLDYHQFVDWSFRAGEPPFDKEFNSAIVDLHYLLALQWAVELEKETGDNYFLDKYEKKIPLLKESIFSKYWNEELQLFTDIPDDTSKLSQHTNCLAILTEVVSEEHVQDIMKKVLAGENMTKATLYWQFYLFEALQKAGMGNEYLQNLGFWEEMLRLGVTTWPETGAQSRSECHGWGSSPNYHLLKISAGVSPLSPGFKSVRIQPVPGEFTSLKTEIPLRESCIKMELKNSERGLKAFVELPPDMDGVFIWKEEKVALKGGKQSIQLKK